MTILNVVLAANDADAAAVNDSFLAPISLHNVGPQQQS